TGGERGLLGLAFPPDYAASGRFYVHFTDPNGDSVVARFKRASTTPDVTAAPASRFDLRWSTGLQVISHPTFANHNAGTLIFGPDGYLYIGMGDGGSGNDPNDNAQNMSSLLGKMLRIDVSVADSNPNGLAIPATNPFRTGPAPEVWDIGLRNPWKFSFDDAGHGGTGAMVIGDVGQDAWEEIDYEPPAHGGVNYGWRNREGANDNVTTLPPAFLPLTDPIFEYPHTVGHAIMGGYVYRGSALGAAMAGRYFFADYVDRRIWSLALTIDPSTGQATASDLQEHTSDLSPGDVTSFGVDASGELYFCNYSAGTVMQIVPAAAPPPVIVGVSPPAGSSAGATGITLTGTGFQSGARVTFGGIPASSVVVAGTTAITAITPAHPIGVVTITVTNRDNQSGTSAFTYTADPPAPFGSFDTPANGSSGVAGSIAVTGWALDDAQVMRLTICRDPVAGEPAGADARCASLPQLYIGDAIFVAGARPDVQAQFPTTPFNSRAGWGYLLLTNFLPNQGNGTFTLRAYASDADGHMTLLGAEVISCANNASMLPFGAIDTPAQGQTVSGASFANFGWVLSPGKRRADPPGGGTVQVLVDGVVVGAPAGWTARSDLTSVFPQAQYDGVNTALGVFGLDTTALTNGLHTIAWVATDNLGAQQGVGSRFFNVANGAAKSSSSAVTAFHPALAARPETQTESASSGRLIYGRAGYDLNAPLRVFAPDASGRVVINIEELGRVELEVNASSGYLVTPAGHAPLPTGSRLDPTTGTFTWQPGAGFLGAFDLVFEDLRLRIVISPRPGRPR
ncbi:MAG TPA: PQQ-dependent sugar dehydrogenase, partial [Vicinamibacterales bacterium]